MKPRRPHQTGPPGLAHDSPRTPNVHIEGLRAPEITTKIPREDPRETQKQRNGGGKGKKKRENFGPSPFWAPTLSGPHPFWAPPFLGTLRGPTRCRLKSSVFRREPLIGRKTFTVNVASYQQFSKKRCIRQSFCLQSLPYAR